MTYTIQITKDSPLHRLNYQWQDSILLNWPMARQYDVISQSLQKASSYTYLIPSNIIYFLPGIEPVSCSAPVQFWGFEPVSCGCRR